MLDQAALRALIAGDDCEPHSGLLGDSRRNRFNDCFAGCRLGKMSHKARLAAPLDVFFLTIATQRNAGERMSSLAELPHEVVAATIGQTKIAYQQIEPIPTG